MKELIDIQSRLVATKDKKNTFGNYTYRSAESILEAVKPLLRQNGCTLTITDDIILIGDRYYVKATATIKNSSGETESASAFARESFEKKGMDPAQVSGSSSSYARKYALGGLFCIDDNKDPDAMDNRDEGNSQASLQDALDYVESCDSVETLNGAWQYYAQWFSEDKTFRGAFVKRKKELTNGAGK